MTRSRKSAKNAGTVMETRTANYLADALDDDRIERRARNGAKDRGDISGVRTPTGERVVIEVKDYGGQIKAGEWVREAHVEAANDDAKVGIVVAKRRGTTRMEDQWVVTTLGDLAVLLGGKREWAIQVEATPWCEATLTVPTQTEPVRCELANDHIMHFGRDEPMPTHRGLWVRVKRRWIEGLPGSNPTVRLTGLNERTL